VIPALDEMRVGVAYEGAASAAIHAFKYERQTRLVEVLGDVLCRALRDVGWPIEIVTAVPLHANRLRERGYNQSALLAHYVARSREWVCVPEAVERVRETDSQVGLNAAERRANVAGAFSAVPMLVEGTHVLIIDDVLTTGATLSACAEALRAAGARGVYGAAVSGAIDYDLHIGAPGAFV
jgi:ComF family protein